MSLMDHAKRELEIAGYFDGDEMNKLMAEDVLKLMEVFGDQGHSGMSAPYAIRLFEKLASYAPLTPLTGEDSEWMDMAKYSGEPCWQNKRATHVFKGADGQAYDIRAVVFQEPNGVTYTSHESRRYIEFPYTPKTEIVHVECSDE